MQEYWALGPMYNGQVSFPGRGNGLMRFALTGRLIVWGKTTSLKANELDISHLADGYEFLENGVHTISPLR